MPSRSGSTAEICTTDSGPFADALRKLERYAVNDHPVVLLGPTGTGKSTLARFVHDHSPRASRAFEAINLGGLDDALASSSLFGHESGAFTGAHRRQPGVFQAACGGTLFCDEFAKASLTIQRKLLDVLDRRAIRPLGAERDVPVNVRLVFAANEPLADLVASGRLLHDFLPRLGLMHVRLPRLSERTHDIPALLAHFIGKHGPTSGYADVLPRATVELEANLQRHTWPDNVRELENLTIRLLVDALPALELSSSLLVDEIERYDHRRSTSQVNDDPVRLRIADAIARAGGVKARAARDLGMGRSTLYRKLGATDDSALRSTDIPRPDA